MEVKLSNLKELKKIIFNKILNEKFFLFEGELNVIKESYYLDGNNKNFLFFFVPPKAFGLGKKTDKMREIMKFGISDLEFKNLLLVKIVQKTSETSVVIQTISYKPNNSDNKSLEKVIEIVIQTRVFDKIDNFL